MTRRRPNRHAAIALGCLALVLASCGGVPVGVSQADPTRVQRELTSNVLNSGAPSVLSTQVLQRQDLYDRWRAVIREVGVRLEQ